MHPSELRSSIFVVASPHSSLRKSIDQTERMLAAVSRPGVHILGHPRGRMFNSRAGVIADWTAVFKRAAETGVAIEIDGDISRQDLDYRVATAAKKAGCVFAPPTATRMPPINSGWPITPLPTRGWLESLQIASSTAGRLPKYCNGRELFPARRRLRQRHDNPKARSASYSWPASRPALRT